MNIKILGARQRIDSLHSKAKSAVVQSDPELQAQLARFCCVLCSGLIEQTIRAILGEYSNRKSSARISRYVWSTISSLRNPKFQDILKLMERFDPDWKEHFETTTSDQAKDAINSIVNNRNQIAHGEQVGLSLATFGGYYKEVIKFLDDCEGFISLQ